MQGMPGVGVPIKRQAIDTSKGIPMFNPAAYQQLAYAQQQPAYMPSVSCKLSTTVYLYTSHTCYDFLMKPKKRFFLNSSLVSSNCLIIMMMIRRVVLFAANSSDAQSNVSIAK